MPNFGTEPNCCAIIVDRGLTVVCANEFFRSLQPFLTEVTVGTDLLKARGEHGIYLRDLCARALNGAGGFATATWPNQKDEQIQSVAIKLAPTPDTAEGTRAARVMVLSRVCAIQKRLPAHFALTPREESIVAQISSGKTLKEASADLAISYHTARKHLQSIFAKTGVRRQAELMVLLNFW